MLFNLFEMTNLHRIEEREERCLPSIFFFFLINLFNVSKGTRAPDFTYHFILIGVEVSFDSKAIRNVRIYPKYIMIPQLNSHKSIQFYFIHFSLV